MGGVDLVPLLREAAPAVLAALIRRFGDFSAAEDAVQEALLAATQTWPRRGIPDNPRGWLLTTAARRLIDGYRSDAARRRRERDYGEPSRPDGGADDTVLLLFLCCHPSLTPASAVALTLRAVAGLSTGQIASAFLVPEATMAQRISRAKQTIADAGARFERPEGSGGDRLASVLHALYLMFNEGYVSSSGRELQRPDLAAEAIRLTRDVHQHFADDRESAGLLALMLLTHARRAARTTASGDLIPLDQQDRSLWDNAAIGEGLALITRTLAPGAGPYQLQAAIAAVHDEAPSSAETDWPQVLVLYDLWRRVSDNPMVTLNRAVAVAMVHGPRAALDELTCLDGDRRLQGHYRLLALRGHLVAKLGETDAAANLYRRAAALTASLPERRYLLGCANA